MADKDKYVNIQKLYRKKFLELQQVIEKDYAEINDKLVNRIRRIAFDYADADGNLPVKNIDIMKNEIDALSYWFLNELKEFLDEKIIKSTEIAISGQDEAAKFYIKELLKETSGTDRTILKKALTDGKSGLLIRVKYGEGLINNIRDYVWDYRWKDGYKLSDRVWRIHGTMNKNLKNIIEQSINQGTSAVEFSRAVEDYLERTGPAWRTDIKPGLQAGDTVKTSDGRVYTIKQPRATVKYNALRLARTETNQAYHRAQQISDKESDIVKGTKWNLSKSHPIYPANYSYKGYNEICDYRAKADHHGIGPGVYPPGETPYDHPNGLCYLTSELLEGEELINKLKEKYS